MKILLLNLWRVINSKGGAEKVFFNMANVLSERGNDVVALALDGKDGEPFFDISKTVRFIDVGYGFRGKLGLKQKIRKMLVLNYDKKRILNEKMYDRQKADRLKSTIEKEEPDIIIAFNIEATRILINYLGVTCPVITMFHFDPDTILKEITPNTKNALEKCCCLQVLLPNDIERVKKYLTCKRVEYIPNVVLQHICPPLRRL